MKSKIIWFLIIANLYSCQNETNNILPVKEEFYSKEDNAYGTYWVNGDTTFYEYFSDSNFENLLGFVHEYTVNHLTTLKSYRSDSSIKFEEYTDKTIGREVERKYHENGRLSLETIRDSIVWSYFYTTRKEFSENGDTLGDYWIEHTLSKYGEDKYMLTYDVIIDKDWQDSITVGLWKTKLGGEITILESKSKRDTVIFSKSILDPEIKCGAFGLVHYDKKEKEWFYFPIPFRLELTE